MVQGSSSGNDSQRAGGFGDDTMALAGELLCGGKEHGVGVFGAVDDGEELAIR